jgi:hypothetical protein
LDASKMNRMRVKGTSCCARIDVMEAMKNTINKNDRM